MHSNNVSNVANKNLKIEIQKSYDLRICLDATLAPSVVYRVLEVSEYYVSRPQKLKRVKFQSERLNDF